MKGYLREQKRQYKELKELTRKHNKKTNELINEHAVQTEQQHGEFLRHKVCAAEEVSFSVRLCSAGSPASDGWCSRRSVSDQDQDLLALEQERCEKLSELKEQQQRQILALRQEQFYSEKYLKREHLKQVTAAEYSHNHHQITSLPCQHQPVQVTTNYLPTYVSLNYSVVVLETGLEGLRGPYRGYHYYWFMW